LGRGKKQDGEHLGKPRGDSKQGVERLKTPHLGALGGEEYKIKFGYTRREKLITARIHLKKHVRRVGGGVLKQEIVV